ncbi:MAG: HIT domain-containing protein [Methylococcales bacterium]|jgi:diadenosine tetraphosphate (Ap4A) HIT family hydrolase|nr:HIT domain-containing protein [Methylococcales bacterium]MCX7076420.1 HIT domain-containing protein [Methylococcales bacterium]
MSTFQLHAQLKQDCFIVGQFELCLVLLLNDSQFPWFILVPQRENIREIYELQSEDQQLLIQESSYFSQKLATIFEAEKLNVAAIGNIVPQLHVHHIVRYQTDKAWPAPVWGKFAATPYRAQQRDSRISKVTAVCDLLQ